MALRAIVLQEEFLAGQEGLLIIGSYLRLGHLYALQGRHAEAKRRAKIDPLLDRLRE